MIEGEFLVADDLGPLGRIVAPGELKVLEKRDAALVRREREWVNVQYRVADQRAQAARKRLKAAHPSKSRDDTREEFDTWTIEAAKYALMDTYLLAVSKLLEEGRQAPMNPKHSFEWQQIPQVTDVVQRVIKASDDEIIGGVVFRAG